MEREIIDSVRRLADPARRDPSAHRRYSERIVIEDVNPTVGDGHDAAKSTVDTDVDVMATVWLEGHAAVAADVVWSGPGEGAPRRTRMTLVDAGMDRFTARITPDRPGLWSLRVEAWLDGWTTWTAAIRANLAAGFGAAELASDLEAGALLLTEAAHQNWSAELHTAAVRLRDTRLPLAERVATALSEPLLRLMEEYPVRRLTTRGSTYRLWADRPRALFGSWYELFPRSTGGWDDDGRPVHGTFATTAEALPRIAEMGFDVVYLPPVHPIGRVNRKGRDNALTAEPTDVGSPWAIGAVEGGHDAVHPELGTLADFDALVSRARELDLEIALDLALQCAPDHPWVREHPEWFTTRPDGTIAYAENPPKKYEDIYPLNFDNDPEGLYREILRVVRHWMAHGVRIFRVDNPHGKPPAFWRRLIAEVKSTDPDVIFLSESFTRPARLYGLARLGFDQNYTYFTWRTTKRELVDFGQELVAHASESRPNVFVNTPDILPVNLHSGLPAEFAIRAALAATLSPTWGVYSGFELFEHVPREPHSEEYLHSEKYELRPRAFTTGAAGTSLEPWITKLNAIRRARPALRQLRTLRFHEVDDDQLIAYSKADPVTGDVVLCVVNLDPVGPRRGTVRWDLAAVGLPAGAAFHVRDEVTGERLRWGATCGVALDPRVTVAVVASVQGPAGASTR